MKSNITLWQVPVILLLFFVLGILAADAHHVVVDGMIFLAALYSFSAGTSRALTPHKAVISVVAAGLIGLAYLVAADTSRELGYYDDIPFICMFAAVYFTGAGSQRNVAKGLSLILTATSAYALWALSKGAPAHEYVKGTFDDSNIFAGLILSSCCASIGLAAQKYSDGQKKSAAYFGLLSCILGVTAIAAHSRGAWIATFVASLTTLLALKGVFHLNKKKVTAVLLAIAVVSLPGIVTKTHSDLSQHNGAGASFKSRKALILSTVQMIKEHPLTGTGWGTWSAVYPQYRTSDDLESAGYRAHNDYLEAWASGGVVGLAELLALPLLLLIAIKRKVLDRSTNRFMLAGALAGTTVLVLQAGMNFIFHQAGLAILGGVLLGALFAQDRDDAAALVTKSTLAWRSLGILVLVGTASFACVAYLAGVPAELIKNPLSSDGLVFSKLMTQENLETLSKLDPMSPIPDFAIAHRYTIAGILTDNKTTQRQAFDQALDYYKKAAKRAPFEPSIPYREAMVYSDYRDMDESARNGRAISALEESLKLNPNYTVALTTYVQMQIKAGHLDEAVKKIKEAQERAPAYEADSLSNLEKLVAFAQKHSLLSSEQ